MRQHLANCLLVCIQQNGGYFNGMPTQSGTTTAKAGLCPGVDLHMGINPAADGNGQGAGLRYDLREQLIRVFSIHPSPPLESFPTS
jgi:hypothetical protein